MGSNEHSNRLIRESSPYLRQHASNPVDWFPWGNEALEVAKQEDRPIFLSIGYSACHWCHVMEHESFENDAIAAYLNAHFVSIKVDREERPDLDQIYMSAVQLLTGRGGWPMSVFLTPELKPFFGGTYWPPEPRMGMPGFRQILEKVHEAWVERRDAVHNGADELTEAVTQNVRPSGEPSPLDERILKNAMQSLLQAADRTHGGFGGAPKFPHPMDLRLLLRCWKRFDNDDALNVAALALDKMAAGGIYDHLGGGFHRYSTDARWLAPHFEKMLYDNALLTSTYLEAYQATRRERYAAVVRETLDYILREMTQPQGGFYSTQDADSEGVEGKFFVWSEAEIDGVLGAVDAPLFKACYDVSARGNWEGTNILNRVLDDEDAATQFSKTPDEVRGILTRCKKTLFDLRTKRIAPGRDDKILVSWNGLMISAMSQAAAVLNQPEYASAATAAAEFILTEMRDEQGRLFHGFKDGERKHNAYLDDYACLIDGLVDLYQATFEAKYLDAALELADEMTRRFHDEGDGGFFYTSNDHEQLITRPADSQDGATPSGNAMAATALLKLGRLCARSDLEEAADTTLERLSGQMARYAMASGQALIALDFLTGPAYEVVLADAGNTTELQTFVKLIHQRFLPNKVVAQRSASLSDDQLPACLAEILRGKVAVDGSVTAYFCERGACQSPAIGAEGLRSALDAL